MNYYEIHKNKKPKSIIKRKRRGYVSVLVPLLCVTSAIGMAQVSIIKSQPIPTELKSNKANAIFESVLNTTKALTNIANSEKQRRFNATKRYVK